MYGDRLKARRYQLVELQVVTALAAGNQLYFQDQPQLRTQPNQLVIVDSIESYNRECVAVAPSGTQTTTAAQNAVCFLVLNIAGTDEMKYIPINRLNALQLPGSLTIPSVNEPLLLDELTKIDWTKSYVLAQGAVAANTSFQFGVFYRYQSQPGG